MADKLTKILVIRFSSLGDLVLSTAFYRELKALEPHSEVHLLTSNEFAPLFAHNRHIKKVHALDRRGGPEAFDQLIGELAKSDWNMIFDLHQSLRSRLALSRIKGWFYRYKKGIFCIDKRSFKRNMLLSFKINLLKDFPSQREAYLAPLKLAFKVSHADAATELFPGKKDKAHVQERLKQAGLDKAPLVALGPGASFPLKRWPKEQFLQLGQELLAKGFQPILLGGPNEEESAWIAEQSKGEIVDLSGTFSFLQTAECLAQCRLAISNDSAIVHFAEAMGTPVIALFGPTVKEFGFGPFLPDSLLMEVELPCRPCSRNGKGKCKNSFELQCMRDLKTEEVLREAMARLGEVKG